MLAYHYPPLADVGSLRVVGFSKYLEEYGWNPIILSVKNPDTSLCKIGNEKPPEGVTVERSRALFNLNRFSYKVNGVLKLLCSLGGKRLDKNIAQDLLCIPDSYWGWILPTLLRAIKLVDKYNIDCVYATSKPLSAAVAAALLKNVRNRPLILDFRDPSSFPRLLFNEGVSGDFNRKMVAAIERYVLKRADKFIVNSTRTGEMYSDLYPFLKGRTSVIYNGFSHNQEIPELTKGFSRFTIAYTGNFYYDMASSPADLFFAALERVVNSNAIPRDDIRFIYLGSIPKRNFWLERLGKKYNVMDLIITPGRVSREESLLTVASSAMVLLRQVPPMITTKVFECLREGTPALALVPEGEVAGLLKKYSENSIVVSSNQVEDVAGALVDAYHRWREGKLKKSVSAEYVERFNKRSLTKNLAHILDELSARPDNGNR